MRRGRWKQWYRQASKQQMLAEARGWRLAGIRRRGILRVG